METLNIETYYKKYAVTSNEVLRSENNTIYIFFKRFLDILLSIIGLFIGISLIVLFSILIILETPGPPIYKQERVGQNGRIFTIYKLRSMYNDAEKNGAQWASKNDSRVTKIGAFIRRTRIDELPQLLNILKGDMSIVGPRPERPSFTIAFNYEIPGFINRLQVKPGLTGWAQINGGYEMTPKEKLEADMYYIKNRNMLMDLKIILLTVKVVLTGKGAR